MSPCYIWQYHKWPKFRWESDKILSLLSDVRLLEGRIARLS